MPQPSGLYSSGQRARRRALKSRPLSGLSSRRRSVRHGPSMPGPGGKLVEVFGRQEIILAGAASGWPAFKCRGIWASPEHRSPNQRRTAGHRTPRGRLRPGDPGGLPGAARQIIRVPRPVVFARLPGAVAGIWPVAEASRESGDERQQPIGAGPVRTNRGRVRGSLPARAASLGRGLRPALQEYLEGQLLPMPQPVWVAAGPQRDVETTARSIRPYPVSPDPVSPDVPLPAATGRLALTNCLHHNCKRWVAGPDSKCPGTRPAKSRVRCRLPGQPRDLAG
jgi:hypothetical protein